MTAAYLKKYRLTCKYCVFFYIVATQSKALNKAEQYSFALDLLCMLSFLNKTKILIQHHSTHSTDVIKHSETRPACS